MSENLDNAAKHLQRRIGRYRNRVCGVGAVYPDFYYRGCVVGKGSFADDWIIDMKLNLPAIYNILAALGLAALGGVLEYLKVEGAAYAWGPLALVIGNSLYQALKVQKPAVEPQAQARGEVAQPESKMRKFLLG